VTHPPLATLAGPPAGIVDAWLVSLPSTAPWRDRLAAALSEDERAQAGPLLRHVLCCA